MQKKLKHKPKRNKLSMLDEPEENDEEEMTPLEVDRLEAIMNTEHLIHRIQTLCLLKSKRREKRGLNYIV